MNATERARGSPSARWPSTSLANRRVGAIAVIRHGVVRATHRPGGLEDLDRLETAPGTLPDLPGS